MFIIIIIHIYPRLSSWLLPHFWSGPHLAPVPEGLPEKNAQSVRSLFGAEGKYIYGSVYVYYT
jgi:hypothetical protein